MESQGTLSELGCLGGGTRALHPQEGGYLPRQSSTTVFLGSPIILLQGVSVADSVVTCAVCLLGRTHTYSWEHLHH